MVDEKQIVDVRKRIVKALKQLNIDSSPIVPVSLISPNESNIACIVEAIRQNFYEPERISSGKFVMSVDHCFPIKGKGTVMTGTIIDGMCRLVLQFFLII